MNENIRNIKFEDNRMNPLNVNLKQEYKESLSVNILPWIPITTFTNIQWETLIRIINDDFKLLFEASKELKNIWKFLFMLWLFWILFWKFGITITQLIWIKILETNDNLAWIIGVLIIFFIMILTFYFYRDTIINKSKKFKITNKLKENIISLEKSIKENNDLNSKIRLKKYEDELLLVNIQYFQKNLIFLWFSVVLPTFIWILWIKYIWFESIINIIKQFSCYDILILLGIILFYYLLFSFFIKEKKTNH